jgi:dTDP-glucose 4,6-dehydratase
MRVLVTGGTGFIGRSLVGPLVSRPDTQVTLLVRGEERGSLPLSRLFAPMWQQLDFVYADLRNYGMTIGAVRKCRPDCVIHLAAAGATDPFLSVDSALRHNVIGTINLLRACYERTSIQPRVIISRSPGELTAMNVYAASKAAAWDFCRMYVRTSQWPILGTMIFQAYGSGQPSHALIPSALAAARLGHDFPMTNGTQKRDWICVDDVVAGLIAVMEADLVPGTTIDLATGQLASVADVVRQIYCLVARGGQPQIGVLPGRPGEELQQEADTERTDSLIGWRAKITLAEGLNRLVAQVGVVPARPA